jgi:Peptidase A4 family
MTAAHVLVRRCAVLALAGGAALALASSASARTTNLVRVGPMVGGPQTRPTLPFNRLGNGTVASTNWSGYAVQSASKFTNVTGTWVQPSVTCSSSSDQYAAFWAGIDGYTSDSVEQIGTDSDCVGRNSPSYYAWYEMYPAGSVDISTSKYPVGAGDTLTGTVSVSGSTFTLSLKDSTRGWTYTTTKTGSGLAQSSAELIAESPEICSFTCRLAQLSDFGTVNFTSADAAVSGGTEEPFSSFTYDSGPQEIVMETSSGTVRAQPSALSTNAFSIAWKHD